MIIKHHRIASLEFEPCHVATELALSELLLSGCTTSTDHHYVFPSGLEEGIDIQVDAARHVGTRVVPTRGSMDLGRDVQELVARHSTAAVNLRRLAGI